jgi:hypothetical protein
MTTMIVEILFWCVVFVGLYLLLKRLQTRRDARKQAAEKPVTRVTEEEGDDGQAGHGGR